MAPVYPPALKTDVPDWLKALGIVGLQSSFEDAGNGHVKMIYMLECSCGEAFGFSLVRKILTPGECPMEDAAFLGREVTLHQMNASHPAPGVPDSVRMLLYWGEMLRDAVYSTGDRAAFLNGGVGAEAVAYYDLAKAAWERDGCPGKEERKAGDDDHP